MIINKNDILCLKQTQYCSINYWKNYIIQDFPYSHSNLMLVRYIMNVLG